MKVIRDSGQSAEINKLMKTKNTIIFFFMDGCGYCEATRPAWSQLSQSGLPFQFVEIESAAVSPHLGINGFPHFHLVDSAGRVRKVDGSKTSKDELSSSLGLTKRSAFRPLRTNGNRVGSRRLRRRVRKSRHRTKRFNISF